MPKYRKKPLEIEAVQLSWATWNEVCDFLVAHGAETPFQDGQNVGEGYYIPTDEVSDACGESGPEYIAIKVTTTHGETAVVRHGDWIIPDSRPGTFYPCKPDVFAVTYDEVVDES